MATASVTIKPVEPTIPLSSLPGFNPLVQAYSADFPAVAAWFDYDPHDPAAVARRLEDLTKYWDGSPERVTGRELMAATVRSQLERWGAGELALDAAAGLAHCGTFAVATGQQAGLFGGPLYTVLKAVSAIRYARHLAREHPGYRFVPVFWIAASDSDFDEVRRVYVAGRDGLAELALPPALPGQDGMMVGARPPEPGLPGLIDRLAEVLPAGMFLDDTLDLVREAYADGRLAEGFARLMARLFAGTELVLVEPQEPALMYQAGPLIVDELDRAARISELVRERNAAITAAGYRLQVDHPAGDTGLFLLDSDGIRDRIAIDDPRDGSFLLRRSGARRSLAELTALAREEPQRFVPDVALRPVYENTLLPVAAFIGGAAEIAYRAQFTALFHAHGQWMAPAYLRATATLLYPGETGLLDELGWGLAECLVPRDEFAANIANRSRPPGVDEKLAAYRRTVESADAELKQAAVALDPNLEQTFSTLGGNLARHIDKLEKKITAALKRKQAALLDRAGRLADLAYPRGNLQERLLSVVGFLPRTGPGLIEQLLDRLEFPCWEHQVVTLE